MNDHASADEADAAHDRCRELRRIVIVRSECVRQQRECRRPKRDERVRLDARRFVTPFAFDADDRAEDEGESEAEKNELRIEEHHDLLYRHLRNAQ